MSIVNIVENLLLVSLILGVLVTIHEFGHFIVAKLCKMKVEEFAIGFGPRIFSKKVGETEYILRLLPIGGYVKILGEVGELTQEGELVDEEIINDPHSFRNSPVLYRVFVILAGVSMNLLLSIILFYILLGYVGFKWDIPPEISQFNPVGGNIVRIKDGAFLYHTLTEDGGAKAAGMPEAGEIKSVDGISIDISSDFIYYLSVHKNQSVSINVCANDSCANYDVMISDAGTIGIAYYPNFYNEVEYKGSAKYFSGFLHVINQTKFTVAYLEDMFSTAKKTGDYTQVAVQGPSSPIALYLFVDKIKEAGLLAILDVVAGLSLSLALLNILPVPAMDGGRALLLLIELFTGKTLNPKIEATIIQVSFYVLMFLMLAIVLKDVFMFKNLQNLFR